MTQAPFYTVGTKRAGFWRRQFAPIPTPAQDKFDNLFAIVLPILFLVLDPVVFKTPARILGQGYLEDYQLRAYLFSSLEIGIFLTWRTFRLPLRRFSSAFAGAFFAGAIFAFVIGIVIFPLSLVGLLFVIGLLGFTPFVTAFVFLRNGVRAARININDTGLRSRFAAAVLSAGLVIAMPVVAQAKVESDVSEILDTLVNGSPLEAEAAAQRLKSFHFVPRKQCDQLALAYGNQLDAGRRAAIGKAYRNVTGEDIEWRYRRNMISD